MLRRPHYIALGLIVLLTLVTLNLPGYVTARLKLGIGSVFLPLFGLANSSQQAAETERAKRAPILHRMQQLVHERTVYAPLWQLAFLNGQGARVNESALGLISGHPYSAPCEELTLKGSA